VNEALDYAHESKTFESIMHSHVDSLQGMHKTTEHLLKELGGVDKMKHFGDWKYWKVCSTSGDAIKS
jgi:hypothetical protein